METINRHKLIPLSRLKEYRDEMDTVKSSDSFDADRKAMDVLLTAKHCWDNLREFRKNRKRNKDFNYGNQWGDLVEVDGETITEEEYIIKQGGMPLKNNLIRRLVRNVIGVYRSQTKEPTCVARDRDEQKLGETMSTVLQYNWQLNNMNEINARSFEDFLIGGIVVHKKTFGWRNDKCECWTNYVNPDNFFVDNNIADFRGWDASIIGEIHDYTFMDVCREFAHSPKDYASLRDIYSQARNRKFLTNALDTFGKKRESQIDFLTAYDPNMCRVIEVWSKEMKPRYRCHDYMTGDYYKIEESDYTEMVVQENKNRIEQGIAQGMQEEDIPLIVAEWFMDDYWYYRFMTPFGQVLKEGETPYAHKSHPYCYKAYPLIDGEIHSFVGDVIDQQKYVNRLIMLHDMIIRSSGKGVVLFPEDSKPDDLSWEDMQKIWARPDGFMVYKSKGGIPTQISGNATNIGIQELLNLQLKLFEDISGVNGALQGKPGFSGMSGTLYAQQTQNATTSLLDLLESFSTFVIECANKDVKNIQQYYDTKRVINIAGKSSHAVEYDPNKIKNVEFDLSIVESTSTPVVRQMANDFLMEIWRANQISLQQLLEAGDFPFADNLLQQIKSQGETLQQGGEVGNLSPEVIEQVQQGVNPAQLSKAQGILQS